MWQPEQISLENGHFCVARVRSLGHWSTRSIYPIYQGTYLAKPLFQEVSKDIERNNWSCREQSFSQKHTRIGLKFKKI